MLCHVISYRIMSIARRLTKKATLHAEMEFTSWGEYKNISRDGGPGALVGRD